MHRTRRYVGAMKEAFNKGGFFESRKELNIFVKNINKGFKKYGRKAQMKVDFVLPATSPFDNKKGIKAYFKFE
jgi:hypothetical protein